MRSRAPLALVLLILAGCADAPPAEPYAVEDVSFPGVQVSAGPSSKSYRIDVTADDYEDHVLRFRLTVDAPARVDARWSMVEPRYMTQDDCAVAAVSVVGEILEAAPEVPGGHDDSRTSDRASVGQGGAAAQLGVADLFFAYDIDAVLRTRVGPVTVDPAAGALGSSGQDPEEVAYQGAWNAGAGTEFLIEVGGHGARDLGGAGASFEANFTVHGPATLEVLEPQRVACGAGLDRAGAFYSQSGVIFGAVQAVATVSMHTENATTLVFLDPEEPSPVHSGSLWFPGQPRMEMSYPGTRIMLSDAAAGDVGFSVEAWTGVFPMFPYWFVGDVSWDEVRPWLPIGAA